MALGEFALGITFVFSRTFRYLTILIIAAICGSILFSLHASTIKENVITKAALVESVATVEGLVIREPSWTAAKVMGSALRSAMRTYVIRTHTLYLHDREVSVRLPLRVFGGGDIALGDEVRITGHLSRSRDHRVSANLNARNVHLIKKASILNQSTNNVRQNFQHVARTFHSDAGALIPGMVLGDTSLQSEEFLRAMRRVGLTHITAVSGANFALVASFVLWLTQWFIRKLKWRIVVASAVLFLFIFLVRPSPSVLRAAVMTAVVLLARARGDVATSASALGAAITAILIADPFQGLEPGFALSVLATAGILFLAPHVSKRLSQVLPEMAADAIAIPASATLMSTPVIVAISGQLSLVTIPVNLLVAPFIGPITVVGFIAALVSPFSFGLSHLLFGWVIPLSHAITMIAEIGAKSPALGLSTWAMIIFISICFTAYFTRRIWLRRHFALIALTTVGTMVLFIVGLPDRTFPGLSWRIFQCDVGQGDALVIRSGNHRAIVIDTGPDPLTMDRCLHSLAISQIDLMILTHNHADHVNGLAGAMKNRIVRHIWANFELSEPHRAVFSGDQAVIGKVQLSVLWPEHRDLTGPTLSGDGSNENNKSITVIVQIDGVSLLATGDLEPVAQSAISQRFSNSVEILKVAHHGSHFQDFTWLSALRPRVALISVGKNNSYGQPAERTIEALVRNAASIHRTDREGGIAVEWSYDSDQLKFRIRHEGHAWWRVRWL